MAQVLTKRDAVVVITDGTRSYVVSLEAGDVVITDNGGKTVEFLDRGRLVGGNASAPADDTPGEMSFTAYLTTALNAADEVSLYGLVRWSCGADEGSASMAEIVAAGWTSTSTRRDGYRTLHVQWFPAGNETGSIGLQVTGAILTAQPKDGDPSTLSVTAKSIDSHTLTEVTAP